MATIVKKCDHTPAQRRSCKCNWTVRYRDSQGKQRERSFKHDQKTLANKFGDDIEHQKTAGELVDPKQASIRFSDAATDWLKRRRSESTRRTYKGLLEIHINPAIGDMTIRAVASPEGRDIVENLLIVTLPAVPLGISRIKSASLVISGVINDAIKRGKLTRSYLTGITLDHVADNNDGKADFVFPEHRQLETMAGKMPAEYRFTLWLMRGCGLRIGEALAVSASDFSNGHLRVHEQLQASKLEYGPLKHRKPGEYRDVPVPSYITRMLAQHQAQPDGRLFAPVWHASYQRWFNKARDAAGISGNFTPHSLRHIFASVALSNNVPITDVSKWLGHRNINMTYRIYGHLVPSSWDRARAVLDKEFEDYSNEA
jgi:integrase